MLTIRELLELRGLDTTQRVKLVRHQKSGWDMEDLIRDRIMEIYQSYQANPIFHECNYIVSFIGQENSRGRFFGVYRVNGWCDALDGPYQDDPKYEVAVSGSVFYYELTKEMGFQDYEGRVIINWGSSALSWHQWLDKHDKEIVEILPKGYVKDFPGFDDLILTYDELVQIIDDPEANREWHRMLASVAGVYLITDTANGDQYVGSAYGEAGILGRWRQYAKTGHGGNIRLTDQLDVDPQYARNYQFSILYQLPRTMNSDDVLSYERLYKKKLGKKATALNAN